MNWISLVIGSALGGSARYAIYIWAGKTLGNSFFYGTLVANLIGCLLIGLLSAIAKGGIGLSEEARLLLMVGFCGSFTTFSTFMLEIMDLIRAGDLTRVFVYVGASLLLGAVLFLVGLFIGRLF